MVRGVLEVTKTPTTVDDVWVVIPSFVSILSTQIKLVMPTSLQAPPSACPAAPEHTSARPVRSRYSEQRPAPTLVDSASHLSYFSLVLICSIRPLDFLLLPYNRQLGLLGLQLWIIQ